MWDLLKPSDIERARQALGDRRAETLRRQRAELEGLAADQAAIDSLDRLAEAFCQKFRKAVKLATAQVAAATPPKPEPEPPAKLEPAPAVKPPAPAVATKPTVPMPAILQAKEKPSRERPPTERRDLSGTNFDIFRRAVSKSTF